MSPQESTGDTSPASTAPAPKTPPTLSRHTFFLVAILVVLLIAGGLSLLASSSPDGLEWVAQETGFDAAARESVVGGTPLAEYSVGGGTSAWSRAAAGVLGVAITAVVAYGFFAVLNRRNADRR